MDILVVGLGCEPPAFMKKLSDTFSSRISLERAGLPRDAFDPSTGQWSAERLVNHLKGKAYGADKVLGMVDVDVSVRSLKFVFGLSEIGGRNGLVSLHRIHDNRPARYEARVLKESIHELGHTFGLQHCPDKSCVMAFSNSVEEVDRKSNRFCEDHTKQLALISHRH